MDPKTRTLEALAIIAESYGVEQDLAALQAAGNWQTLALAALALEVKPSTARGSYARRA